MFCTISLTVFGLGASAAVLARDAPCSFSMSAIGCPNGTIVEDTIGEIQIGGIFAQGSYMLHGNTLTDSLNHNCTIQSSTLQFECTEGTYGTTNFSLANDGNLLHDGSEKWLACSETSFGNGSSWNIFSDSKADTGVCEAITLMTEGSNCTTLGGPSSSASGWTSLQTLAPTTISSASPTSSSTATACPTDISSGTYLFPHLIVPTSPEDPNHAFGGSSTAYISPVNTTLFNFDIPSTIPYNGTCALVFLFPFASDEDPSAGTYYFSGIEEEEGEHGGLDFALLEEVANAETTYNTTGDVAKEYGTTQIIPGNNYQIARFSCESGETVTYSASSKGNVELDYFQDSAPSPIGLYIVPCA